MKEMINRFKPIAIWIGALAAIAIALVVVESDLLWKVQHSNLFLYSLLFFKQQMVVPGGMLSYLGAFFTQFFYIPWLGVLMLCGWWLLLLWLTKRTFCIPDKWSIVALVPVAILLTMNTDLGYWVYAMKLRGYWFVATIGTTAAIALLRAFRKLPQRLWMRISYIVLVVLAGYPLMGVYALAAALLMGVWTWRLTKNTMQNAVLTGTALLTIMAIPLLYYRFVYYQTNIALIYRTALPLFTIREDYPQYNIPYYLLAVCFLAFAVIFRETVPESVQKGKKPILRWAIQGVLLAGLVVGVFHFWYKDANFHHELRMERCVEQADWEGVLAEGKKQDSEPTRAIVMMHNLALSRLGRQLDEMYDFPKGSARSKTSLPIYMYNTAGYLIYYQYGVLNECHRMCMEQGVKYGWSPELLKYMARCSLLGGETQAVRKYLTLLRQTQFYGEWADHMEQLLTHPEQIAQDKETAPVTHMLHYENVKGSDNGSVEKYLMTMLSKTDSDDPYFQEQAVLAAMWSRNPEDFWPRFIRYTQLHQKEKLPRIFLEAACLFGHMLQMEDIDNMPDQNVVNNYRAFMQQMSQHKGTSSKELRTILRPFFGNTYFYEYFFLKDITYF